MDQPAPIVALGQRSYGDGSGWRRWTNFWRGCTRLQNGAGLPRAPVSSAADPDALQWNGPQGEEGGSVDPFAPRDHAALDYWFWKFHVGDLAFLVDVIIRRAHRHVGDAGELPAPGETEGCCTRKAASWSADATVIIVGGTELRPGRSVGVAGDVRWDLQWSPGSTLVSPLRGTGRTVRTVRHVDGRLAAGHASRAPSRSVPRGSRSGTFPGAFTHYWGRRLLERWVWLSATQFDGQPQRRLRGSSVGRSRLFGRLPSAPVSILWTTDGPRERGDRPPPSTGSPVPR